MVSRNSSKLSLLKLSLVTSIKVSFSSKLVDIISSIKFVKLVILKFWFIINLTINLLLLPSSIYFFRILNLLKM